MVPLAVAQLLLLPLLWFIPEHGKTRASLSLPAGSIGTGCILMAGDCTHGRQRDGVLCFP